MTSVDCLKYFKNCIIDGKEEQEYDWWCDNVRWHSPSIEFLYDIMSLTGVTNWFENTRTEKYNLISSAIEYARCYE